MAEYQPKKKRDIHATLLIPEGKIEILCFENTQNILTNYYLKCSFTRDSQI